jgi:hypothetical protein
MNQELRDKRLLSVGSLKNTIKVNSVVNVVIATLFAFVIFVGKGWLERIEKLDNALTRDSNRITKLETESVVRWELAKDRLYNIEMKLDRIIEEKGK